MKFFDNLIKKSTKTASVEVKKEIKKTIVDLIPGILTIGTIALGIFVFHAVDNLSDSEHESLTPTMSTTRITTNNYFLGDVSEEIIKKILGDD